MSAVELARAGINRTCVDCGDRPWGGGMRCLDCFQARCDRNAGTEHLCVRHPPGASCYQICRCRCGECREWKRAYARTFR
jgi:hypothetical protein